MDFEPSLLFTPDGVRDVYGRECREYNVIRRMIRQEMELYGFRDIKTPSYEFFDIFNKELFRRTRCLSFLTDITTRWF